MSLKRKASTNSRKSKGGGIGVDPSPSLVPESGSSNNVEGPVKKRNARKVNTKTQLSEADHSIREMAWPEHFQTVCMWHSL